MQAKSDKSHPFHKNGVENSAFVLLVNVCLCTILIYSVLYPAQNLHKIRTNFQKCPKKSCTVFLCRKCAFCAKSCSRIFLCCRVLQVWKNLLHDCTIFFLIFSRGACKKGKNKMNKYTSRFPTCYCIGCCVCRQSVPGTDIHLVLLFARLPPIAEGSQVSILPRAPSWLHSCPKIVLLLFGGEGGKRKRETGAQVKDRDPCACAQESLSGKMKARPNGRAELSVMVCVIKTSQGDSG